MNSPNAAERSEQERVLEDRGDHCGEEGLGEGVERPAADEPGEHEPGGELQRGSAEDEEGRRKRDAQLGQDALERRRRIEAELLRRPEPGQPEEERRQPGDPDQVDGDRLTIPQLASRHRRDGTRRARQQWRTACSGGWSGRRDSNPRHPAWKASALPAELLPLKLPVSNASRTLEAGDSSNRRYRTWPPRPASDRCCRGSCASRFEPSSRGRGDQNPCSTVEQPLTRGSSASPDRSGGCIAASRGSRWSKSMTCPGKRRWQSVQGTSLSCAEERGRGLLPLSHSVDLTLAVGSVRSGRCTDVGPAGA